MTATPSLPLAALPQRLHPELSGIDLHMHSSASDGALAPEQLIKLCADKAVGWVALTDHDTLDGVAPARQAAEAHGIALLCGVELSTQWAGVGIHVVALLPQGEAQALAGGSPMAEALKQLEWARCERAERIAAKLEKAGLDDALTRARHHAGGRAAVGRPHFARAMVEAGLVADQGQAFKRFLGAGKACDIKTLWPELSQLVGWIRAASGVAVLAHPLRYGLTRRRLGLLLDDFGAAGGEAAELVSGYQNPDRGRDLARLLGERKLYASLGSDFHAPGGPLVPGRYSPPPNSAVVPVWHHPRLAAWFDQRRPRGLIQETSA